MCVAFHWRSFFVRFITSLLFALLFGSLFDSTSISLFLGGKLTLTPPEKQLLHTLRSSCAFGDERFTKFLS